jgi:hypothetical protein
MRWGIKLMVNTIMQVHAWGSDYIGLADASRTSLIDVGIQMTICF